MESWGGDWPPAGPRGKTSAAVILNGVKNLAARIARCCGVPQPDMHGRISTLLLAGCAKTSAAVILNRVKNLAARIAKDFGVPWPDMHGRISTRLPAGCGVSCSELQELAQVCGG